MRRLRPDRCWLALALLLAFGRVAATQEQAGVLAPEDANEARLNRLQPPEQVMDAIGLVPGMTVAEVGAGRGRYTVQLAVRVGSRGRVYAEDIDAAALDHLKTRCGRWGLAHVSAVLGSVTDPKLPVGALDLILVISSYHHFEDPVRLMRNARESLKPGGRLAVAEWLASPGSGTSPERLEAQMKTAGYRLERIDKRLEGNNLYLYLFRPEEPR
jgi:ubiquinone/menaquinone biosynthesis C-methylase UbiE